MIESNVLAFSLPFLKISLMNIRATRGNIKKAIFGYLTLRRKKSDKATKNQKTISNIQILFFLKKSHGTARTMEIEIMARIRGSGVDPLKNGKPKTAKRSTIVTECNVLTALLFGFKK